VLRARHALRGPSLRSWPIGASWWRGAHHRVPRQAAMGKRGVGLASAAAAAAAAATAAEAAPAALLGGVPPGARDPSKASFAAWSHALVLATGSADGKVYLFDASQLGRTAAVDASLHTLDADGALRDASGYFGEAPGGGSAGPNGGGGGNGEAFDGAAALLGHSSASGSPPSLAPLLVPSQQAGGGLGPLALDDGHGCPVSFQVLDAGGGGGAARVYCVDWHPTEPRLASAGADGVVRLWQPVKGQKGARR